MRNPNSNRIATFLTRLTNKIHQLIRSLFQTCVVMYNSHNLFKEIHVPLHSYSILNLFLYFQFTFNLSTITIASHLCACTHLTINLFILWFISILGSNLNSESQNYLLNVMRYFQYIVNFNTIS